MVSPPARARLCPALLVGVVLLGGAACNRHKLPTTTLTVGGHRLLVEVADDGEERGRGLMNRNRLPADEGMLFVYPRAEPRSFWMENTRIPLSIAFIGTDGVIFATADMRPLSRRATKSGEPALYALEVNQGWFEAHGIGVGTRVEGLPGPSKY